MPTFQIIVCAGIVPEPLQTLEPVENAGKYALKNEAMLPMIIDPWGMHALYEAAHLSKTYPGSKIYLVVAAPKGKLQQVMMTIAQKVPFELIAIDTPAGGFTEAYEVAKALEQAIKSIPALDMSQTLLFGGWESASRCSGATMQMLGEMLGITEQFQGVDTLTVKEDGSFEIMERVEGGLHQKSTFDKLPAVLGWATGDLPEPPNNPQIGMMNMRGIMPSIMKAKKEDLPNEGIELKSCEVPKALRETKIVDNMTEEMIANEIFAWIKKD